MSASLLYVLPQLSCDHENWEYWPKPFQAVFIKVALTWSGVSAGLFCNSNATAPLTTGVAMLVPLNTKYIGVPLDGATSYSGYFTSSVLPATRKETSRLPGATRSGFTM